MLKETLKFEDFNEQEQTKEFYFNLSRAEFTKLELGYRGGIEQHLKQIIDDGNGRKIIEFFETVVEDSYGVRSVDGTEFIKNPEVYQRFKSSGALDAMIEKVLADPNYALTFIRGILPGKYQDAIRQAEAEQAAKGFRPGAATLPQSEIDKRARLAEDARIEEETAAAADQANFKRNLQAAGAYPPESEVSEQWPHPTPTAPQVVEATIDTSLALPEDPLTPEEPGYQQGLTRRQARELGLL